MPSSKAKTVIWDMDGVIADTAPYHLEAWQEVFQKRGVTFVEEDFRRTFGQRNDTIIKSTMGEETPPDEIGAIAGEKEADFRRRIGEKVKPLPGVIELLRSLQEHRFKMALASSAPIENIQLLSRSLGISSYFQSTICDTDVTEGKPSPEGFLLAAKKLKVEPDRCIVIEDAPAGITAANRAGMRCLTVTSTHPRSCLTGADLIVDTLQAVSAGDLEGLINRQREYG